FHVGGVSNGGISAFRFAIFNAERVQSLIVLPGFPRDGADNENLANLKGIPVAMFVGGDDSGWVAQMTAAEQAMTDLGIAATLEIVPGEGHIIQSLDGGVELFDLLDSFRGG
ncbi:MAG: hypothetical protein WAM60_24440, partial [Candidatus Promineifilaceae bacterium]